MDIVSRLTDVRDPGASIMTVVFSGISLAPLGGRTLLERIAWSERYPDVVYKKSGSGE